MSDFRIINIDALRLHPGEAERFARVEATFLRALDDDRTLVKWISQNLHVAENPDYGSVLDLRKLDAELAGRGFEPVPIDGDAASRDQAGSIGRAIGQVMTAIAGGEVQPFPRQIQGSLQQALLDVPGTGLASEAAGRAVPRNR